jgi:hypothetical protein
MSPGGVSGHVHAIAGGGNFAPVYDYDHSLKSEWVIFTSPVYHLIIETGWNGQH